MNQLNSRNDDEHNTIIIVPTLLLLLLLLLTSPPVSYCLPQQLTERSGQLDYDPLVVQEIDDNDSALAE